MIQLALTLALVMTGLEPHPIFELPDATMLRRLEATKGERAAAEALARMSQERAKLMSLERTDPFQYGFEPAIWHLVDDLLVDGNKIVLDVSRLEKLNSGPDGRGIIDVPLEIAGAPEVYIAGANRATKSEYGGKKIMKVLKQIPSARTWSFADTGPISIARQQPLFWKYMPAEIKRLAAGTGKVRQGAVLNISYKQKTGFAEQSFVLPNGSQHWFKNYEQDIENVEGDQLDAIWLDELRNIELLRTLRGRTIDRGGIIIVTFTAIDDNYSAVFNEYERGARTVFEVEAELLPIKKPIENFSHSTPTNRNDRREGMAATVEEGTARKPVDVNASASAGRLNSGDHKYGAEFEIIGYKKVPRIKVAGPGSDGNQRANIVYFHAIDNPYFGYEGAMNRAKVGRGLLFGKERFYRAYRGATETKILSRVYGILSQGSAQQFPKFNDAVHVIDPRRIPAKGTNFHVVDPCDGRNWFMVWIRIDSQGRWYVYREWPSTGHPGAYIPGRGDPGPWALPGQPYDGVRGPAQQPFGFGLERYIQEITRLENGEEIADRWMDSRYAANPTTTKEGSTTHIMQLSELGMDFLAASGKEISEGTGLINDKLDYDQDLEIGKFSPNLARLNEPKLFVSRDCPNVIYSLREWTNKDKQHGACKDPVDVLRYAALAGLDYIGADAYTWQGGGSY